MAARRPTSPALAALAAAALAVAAAAPLPTAAAPAPEEAAPALLQIRREAVRPGREAAYRRAAEEASRACARLRCPKPWVALTAVTGPGGVWTAVGFGSWEDVERTAEAQARDARLEAELARLAERKADLVLSADTAIFRRRDDLGPRAARWVAGARWIAVDVVTVEPARAAEFEEARRTGGFALGAAGARVVYEAVSGLPRGTYLVVAPLRTLADADGRAGERVPGGAARVDPLLFAVSPAASHPAPDWVEADPSFWKPPAPPAAREPAPARPKGGR